MMGIEPTTSPLIAGCSTTELHVVCCFFAQHGAGFIVLINGFLPVGIEPTLPESAFRRVSITLWRTLRYPRSADYVAQT